MRQQTYQLIDISYHLQHIEHLGVQTDGKMAVKKNYLTYSAKSFIDCLQVVN